MTPVGGLWYWYTTSAILAFFTVINILSQLYRYLSRAHYTEHRSPGFPRIPSLRTSASSSVKPCEEKGIHGRQVGTVSRALRALHVIWEKYVRLNAFKLPWPAWPMNWFMRSVATSEFGVTFIYVVVVMTITFVHTDLNIRTVSSQSAWVAVAQVPLIIALVGKNNLISFLIGVSHEKLNYLHRAAGRVCLVGVWIHFGCMLSMHHGITKVMFEGQMARWGTVGVASFTLMTVLSIRTIRHRLYEFFLVAHICLAVLTLAAFIKHWSAMGPWIYPGFGLWAADRILRVIRLFVLNKLWVVMPSPTGANIPSRATLTLLTPSTVMVSFQTPSRLLTWAAGQHFFVVMPGMTRFPWEAHPFTAATLPARPGQGTGKGELTFIVRVRDGFTKRMKDHVDEERKARGLGPDVQVSVDIPAAVEGPYGESRSLDRYDGVLILTGGSGISYGIAHLMQIVRDAREGKTRVKFVRIIWMVKTRLHLDWISPILLGQVNDIPTSLQIQLHVHVTKQYRPVGAPIPTITFASPRVTLPNDPGQAPRQDLEDYFAQRITEPPRRTSRMSSLSWATFTSHQDPNPLSAPGTPLKLNFQLGETKLPLVPTMKLPRLSVSGPTGRRGSLGFEGWKGLDEKNTNSDRGESKIERHRPEPIVIPTFKWSDTIGEIPRSEDISSTTRNVSKSPRSPLSPLRPQMLRVTSEAPSFHSFQEDDDGRNSGEVSPRHISKPLPETEGTDDEINKDNHDPDNEASDDVPTALLPIPPPRAKLLSSPKSQHRIPVGSLSERRNIGLLLPPSPRKPSGLIVSYLPPDSDPPITHSAPSSPGHNPLNRSISMKRSSSAQSTLSAQSSNSQSHQDGLEKSTLGLNSTSIARSETVRSTISNSSAFAPLPSGALTPALVQAGTKTFAEDARGRRGSALGLERYVHWHEGRADLHASLRELLKDVGKGGRVSVNACGPRGLLVSARETARALGDVKGAWGGESVVDFNAETFGW